ncbi:cation diffusion facilitator transporter [Sphaerisporangium krabiense]|uniref:Cation diffusion facilitator family transporter n=1 Tax=Sphaerisporangium krabiense TaxID=763782 RepID=A0A7W9DST0_9ACTN|nr:cation diffusion facilitator family transporter [Sphaerisporangium krabiense]MBB5629439.1 cation diffusion facilitator family transporter [Sphaerisporangium krabiense]GII65711.1 cation diffusion facilitator transporter [Sphaerisporangium krabiense]
MNDGQTAGAARRNGGKESFLTVLVAAGVNLAIAVAKFVAGLLSGSSAMLSEAAHSAADTVTEILLLLSVRRAEKPADPRHPFGYGKAGFFWALMAAGATLVIGAGFSMTHGVQTIREGEELGDLRVSFAVLAISFVLEAISFLRALHQVRGEARRLRVSPGRYVARTADTAVKAVVFEDAAALAGILIAALGLVGALLTGSALWDGLASVVIGLLLLGVALHLIRANASLLIGQAASPRLREAIEDELTSHDEVSQVVELLTMMLGPNDVLVAAKVDFVDECTGARLEAAADRMESRLMERFPRVSHVFLDPTPGRAAGTVSPPLAGGET